MYEASCKTALNTGEVSFRPLALLDIPGLTGMIFDKDTAGKPMMMLTEFPVNSYLKGDLQANQMDVIFILADPRFWPAISGAAAALGAGW